MTPLDDAPLELLAVVRARLDEHESDRETDAAPEVDVPDRGSAEGPAELVAPTAVGASA